LKSLSVRLDAVSTSSPPGSSLNTRLMIVRITVGNLTGTPQRFNEGPNGQFALQAKGKAWVPDLTAKPRLGNQALAGPRGSIPAGATTSGDVAFDVPASFVQTVLQHGALIVVDFGTTSNAAASGAVLRIY
jgi:hypothetical protein